jgi:hypothetical protein
VKLIRQVDVGFSERRERVAVERFQFGREALFHRVIRLRDSRTEVALKRRDNILAQ